MNNYLQVELGGRKRGLKFNLGTIFFAKETSALAANMELDNDIKEAAVIVHSALLSNCRNKKEEPDFTFSDVVDWVYEIENLYTLTSITNAFSQITQSTASPEGGQDTQQYAA